MEWSRDAEDEIGKVPFFVRRRVRQRVEQEAASCGDRIVTLEHVNKCRRRFLNKMEDEVKGFQVETCFGPAGCPNRAVNCASHADAVERVLEEKALKAFLKGVAKGPLKLHHEFRISISDCPNACSRPQIVDVGFIGALRPIVTNEYCNRCNACVETCKEDAISLTDEGPLIDGKKCLMCGACVNSCPSGSITEGDSGYRVLVGGKLGRHPKLGQDLGTIIPPESLPHVVSRMAEFFKLRCRAGERFGEILERNGACSEVAAMVGLDD